MQNDTKKYYWIKLRTDFFNQETIDFLLSQQNGCEYVVLYQMLCLQTANTDGSLINQVGEMIVPYNIEKIVRDTKYFDYDTIVVALELYKKIGLIYEEDNGNLKISDIDKMIGSETIWAEKKRLYREKQKLIENKEDNVLDNFREENRDKSIDIRYKILDNNKKEIYKEKFEEFYKNYPKKLKKAEVEKWFKKNNPDDELFKTIMTQLEKFKKSKEWKEQQYIPYPSTWLNQKRWEDEIKTQEDIDKEILDYLEEMNKNEE